MVIIDILGVIAMFVIFIGIGGLIEFFANKKTEKPKKQTEYDKQYEQEIRWKDRENFDKEMLEQDSDLKQNMIISYEKLKIGWEVLVENNNSHTQFEKSITCLTSLTPNFFLEHYYKYKSGDYRNIKDAIYKQRPYFSLDLFIKLGLYIFQTNNQIEILKYIIQTKDENYIYAKEKAKKILEKEIT